MWIKKLHKQQLPFFLLFSLSLVSCGTYYSQQIKFQRLFIKHHLEEADSVLAKNKRAPRGKNRLLYYLNRGVTHHLMQDYEASNAFFERAYMIHQDFVANLAQETLAFLINPNISDYPGEDHEILFIHYYKAINYLQMNDMSAALVECRRLNIALNELNDKYTENNKYNQDAFIHLLMGLIYQANHAYNDAFIAYRNSFNIFQHYYPKLFGIQAPLQLKKDLIYAAYHAGLYEEATYYAKEFQLPYPPKDEIVGGDMVCLWNNGLGPIKQDWEINFMIIKGKGGVINFVNEELGLCFPFFLGSNEERAEISFSDLHMLRVAFPKYVERPLHYKQGFVMANDQKYVFSCVENVNAIAFQVLHQRMIWECSKSLLRLAIKKIAELQVRKQNEILGTLFGIATFVTEQADTRNWQTLPHSIYYTRLRLPEGTQQITFCPVSDTGQAEKIISNWHIYPNQTVFCIFNTF